MSPSLRERAKSRIYSRTVANGLTGWFKTWREHNWIYDQHNWIYGSCNVNGLLTLYSKSEDCIPCEYSQKASTCRRESQQWDGQDNTFWKWVSFPYKPSAYFHVKMAIWQERKLCLSSTTWISPHHSCFGYLHCVKLNLPNTKSKLSPSMD